MNNVDFEGILIKRHHYWRNLLIVLFIAVVIAGVWWVQIEQESPAPEQTVNPLCAEFSPVEEEITCEEAIDIALEEYPGEVYLIDKTQITPPKPPGEEGSITKDLWLIGIDLDVETQSRFEPKTDKLEITIDRISGRIIGLSPIYST